MSVIVTCRATEKSHNISCFAPYDPHEILNGVRVRIRIEINLFYSDSNPIDDRPLNDVDLKKNFYKSPVEE